jgi:hypothetical protein
MKTKLNAASRLVAADFSNFDDHPQKPKAQELAISIEKSLRSAGCRVVLIPNKLLNRTLTGPNKGYFFTVKTDAPYSDCVQMMEDAGWARKAGSRTVWSKRGGRSFSLSRSHEGEGSIFFI